MQTKQSKLYLFKDIRFLPLFIVQFLGCLNDSILKNALIILITFKLSSDSLPFEPYIMIMMANAFFTLPFILFASAAGQITDKYERTKLVKIIKFLEISIISLALVGFYFNNIALLYSCVFLMGIHSTFFGPIKYSVLPDLLKKNELLGANGFVEAGTFLSILIGTTIGSCYTISQNAVIFTLLAASVIGFMGSFFIPKTKASNPELKINFNIWKETKTMIKVASSKQTVYFAMLGISWFWFIAASIMSQIPALTHDILGADENVVNLFLATFSIGVGVGSFVCNKILNDEITSKYVFIAALGISIFGIDLYFASKIATVSYQPEHLKSVMEFLSKKHYLRILLDLFCLAAVGGIYVVPLFAIMQYHSSANYRNRVIAANNFINSAFMICATLMLSLLFNMGFSIPTIILTVSILNVIVAFHIYQLIPGARIVPFRFWQILFKFFFDKLYDIEVNGLKNYHKSGKRTVVVANHLSYIDPALIAVYLPQGVTFAINKQVAQETWVKPFLHMVKTFPVDQNSPMAIKALIAEVKKNKKIAIFPEGRISTTGSLMKIYEGPGMIADKANATILPIRIEGTQFTRFAKVPNTPKHRLFSWRKRKIVISVLEPVEVGSSHIIDIKERRKYISQVVYDIMSEMMFKSGNYRTTLFDKLLAASTTYGKSKVIMQDTQGMSITYRELIRKSISLALTLPDECQENSYIGIMLPNSVNTKILFWGAQIIGLVPAMMSYTDGIETIIANCKTASIKYVITSRQFLVNTKFENYQDDLLKNNIKTLYIEDIQKKAKWITKFKSFLFSLAPKYYYDYANLSATYDDAAVILFTYGTEGEPKAVVLSHTNINANICQIVSKIDFNSHDISFNALPIFHCFGFIASILTVQNGIKSFYYISQSHYKIIPDLIYDINATILFGTNTLLYNYAGYAHPYDFYSLRHVFSSSEALTENTRQLWLDKFGIRILEGYGMTETSSVISLNTPMHYKVNTVGKMMPGIEYFLKDKDIFDGAGILCIKGENVMMGYMTKKNPGIIEQSHAYGLGACWVETSDIVRIDEEGFVKIIDRKDRFAKIGEKMIPLTLLEKFASNLEDKYEYAAIAALDAKKIAKIILFTTNPKLEKNLIVEAIKESSLPDFFVPEETFILRQLPKFASGKINYSELKKIYESK